MSQREHERFARSFHASEYRTDLRRIAALGVEKPSARAEDEG